MNRRRKKKKEKKAYLHYIDYLHKIFDKEDLWCIEHDCQYYDYSGIYGGGCADHLGVKGFRCNNPY